VDVIELGEAKAPPTHPLLKHAVLFPEIDRRRLARKAQALGQKVLNEL
jgi:hypothetical protein